MIGSRREARETALGLLYEADVRGETPADTLARQIVPPVEYARVLLTGVAEHRDEIDELLRGVSHGWAIERMAIIDRALLRLSTYELAHRPDVPTGAVLSLQRRLELIRALATRPKLLMLDEPAAGMDSTETHGILDLIRLIRDRYGVAVIVVEHDMDLIMNLCERIQVLAYGERIFEGTPAEVQANPQVREVYLGHA